MQAGGLRHALRRQCQDPVRQVHPHQEPPGKPALCVCVLGPLPDPCPPRQDVCAGGLYWWAVGYAFAFGDHTDAQGNVTQNPFIGGGPPLLPPPSMLPLDPPLSLYAGSKYFFFSSLPQSSYSSWFFQFAFACEPLGPVNPCLLL